MTQDPLDQINRKLDSLIDVLSRLAPPPLPESDLGAADCFVWNAETGRLDPVVRVNRVDIALIKSVDRVRDILVDNTRRFAAGFPANNVLLWGARGMGKSSLVKAAHATINAERGKDEAPLKLVEIHREDISALPRLMTIAKGAPLSVIAAKASVRATMDLGCAGGLEEGKRLHEVVYASNDAIEGPKAFAEKREPVWTGT